MREKAIIASNTYNLWSIYNTNIEPNCKSNSVELTKGIMMPEWFLRMLQVIANVRLDQYEYGMLIQVLGNNFHFSIIQIYYKEWIRGKYP